MKGLLVVALLLSPFATHASCTTAYGYTSCMYTDSTNGSTRIETIGPDGQRQVSTSRLESNGDVTGYSSGSNGPSSIKIHPLRDGNTMITQDGKTMICSRSKCY